MKFSDLFGFEKFVSPSLIKIAYWIGVVFIVLGWLGSVLIGSTSMYYSYSPGFWGFIIKTLGSIIALIGWRVTCELGILAFSIRDRLGEIRDRLPRQ